jgi:hypothetical protein
MGKLISAQPCSRCGKPAAGNEIICNICISDLLEIHNHMIGWEMALEIENEEKKGNNLIIEIQ